MDPAGLVRLITDSVPFATVFGINLDDVTPQRVIATMDWAADRCTTGGVLHGGALMALADTVGAVCAVANLPTGAGTATIESKTNFFQSVRGGRVTATSIPLHVGRTTIVAPTDLTDERGKLVAGVTQTQAVLPQ